jgi:hypothetical protein
LFVSYARKDRAFVTDIVASLRNRHIPVWVDEQIDVGTPNYELAIREAIRRSFAVLFIASPNALASHYVLGELRVAQYNEIPIYPAWVWGESWEDSAPTQMIASQYCDLRPSFVEEGTKQLFALIEQRIDSVLPRHIDPHTSESLFIDVSHNQKSLSFRYSAFRRVIEFIDDVYEHLVQDHSPPMYGRGWVLVGGFHEGVRNRMGYADRRVSPVTYLVPWAWLGASEENQAVAVCDPAWYDQRLEEVGLVPGTSWRFHDLTTEREPIFGVTAVRVEAFDIIADTGGSVRESYGVLTELATTGEAVFHGVPLKVQEFEEVDDAMIGHRGIYGYRGTYKYRNDSGYGEYPWRLHRKVISEA